VAAATIAVMRLLLKRYRDLEVAGDEQVAHRNPWTMVAVTRLPLEPRGAWPRSDRRPPGQAAVAVTRGLTSA
jgi:hypothetical protein